MKSITLVGVSIIFLTIKGKTELQENNQILQIYQTSNYGTSMKKTKMEKLFSILI
jgi:hypothetical protein